MVHTAEKNNFFYAWESPKPSLVYLCACVHSYLENYLGLQIATEVELQKFDDWLKAAAAHITRFRQKSLVFGKFDWLSPTSEGQRQRLLSVWNFNLTRQQFRAILSDVRQSNWPKTEYFWRRLIQWTAALMEIVCVKNCNKRNRYKLLTPTELHITLLLSLIFRKLHLPCPYILNLIYSRKVTSRHDSFYKRSPVLIRINQRGYDVCNCNVSVFEKKYVLICMNNFVWFNAEVDIVTSSLKGIFDKTRK